MTHHRLGSLCTFVTDVSLWEKIELPCEILGTMQMKDFAVVLSEPVGDIRRDFYVKVLTRFGVGYVAEGSLK